MKKSHWLAVIVTLAAASSLPTTARAASIEYITDITDSTFSFVDGGCNGAACSGTFQKDFYVNTFSFDASLGELTGVAFEFFNRHLITAQLECTTGCPFSNSTADLNVRLFLNDPEAGISVLPYIALEASDSRVLGCQDGCTHIYDFDVVGGRVVTEELDRFLGLTPLRFRYIADEVLFGTTRAAAPDLVIVDQLRLVTTYVYTPVPEPGTGILLASGIAIMGFRRKQARRVTR